MKRFEIFYWVEAILVVGLICAIGFGLVGAVVKFWLDFLS